MLNRITSLLCLNGLLLIGSSLFADSDLRIYGSDLLKPALEPLLTNWGEEENVSLQTEFYGTLPTRAALEAGKADLTIMAIPDGKVPDESRFQSIPLAFEIMSVYVNASNPVPEISIPQLAGIFGNTAEVNYSRWGEIGIPGAFGNRAIQPVALRQAQGVGIELFKHVVLHGDSLKPQTNYVPTEERLLEILRSDVGAIAIANLSGKKDGIKVLPISKGKGESFSFGPTPDNVYYGDYPIRLPFYLVFPIENKSKILPALRLLLGEKARNTLIENGFIPLPENVARRTLQELDIPR